MMISVPTQRTPPEPIHVELEGGELLRLHRGSGQGYLLVAGKRRYFGPFHGPDGNVNSTTLERATRFVRQGPEIVTPASDHKVTFRQLTDLFLADIEGEHGKDSKEADHFAYALEFVCASHGSTFVDDFSPKVFKATRSAMVKAPSRKDPEARRWSRWTVNSYCTRIIAAIKWGVGSELVAPHVPMALLAVEKLKKGRASSDGLRESRKVKPAVAADVERTLPFLSRQLQAVVLIQRWCGARPSEVLNMTPSEVDRSSIPWHFSPRSHKGSWKDLELTYSLPKQAREALAPFLLRALDTPCFSPIEAETERLNATGIVRRRPLPRPPGETYGVSAYGRAVRRACKRAGVASWSPHQLRHLRVTEAERIGGPEAGRCVAGHTTLSATKRYVHRDHKIADEIAMSAG